LISNLCRVDVLEHSPYLLEGLALGLYLKAKKIGYLKVAMYEEVATSSRLRGKFMQMLSYVSEAQVPDMERDSIMQRLMHVAQKRNAELDVTGVLFLRGNTFFQIIEGADDSVQSLFQDIASDPKHKSVCVLVNEPIIERRFSGWSMACFHDPSYQPDYLGSLSEIDRYFENEFRFTSQGVYEYFSELSAGLASVRLTKVA